ncbi:MAG: shikimate dehydrogenase [Candidatus Omnitrophica bacterium]|nr:shikimate dehydrogenase [Candidatus Omnitrophota bacterium]
MTPQDKQIYGLIGNPVKHSLSPAMHNAAFKALKINAEYQLFELKPEEIKKFISELNKINISGLNITVPYKEQIIPFLSLLSDEAKLIGAVNTIKVSGNKLAGFNTDAPGFIMHLTKDLKFSPQGKSVCIIGAGGAAKAVTVSLANAKVKSISIFDIDSKKMDALVSQLRNNFKAIKINSASSIDSLGIKECDLLVNTTPIGMRENDPCLVREELIHKDLLVYDVIYNPKETKLLKLAKEKGARFSNGLGMLLYQGVAAFEIWTEGKAPVEIMRAALEEGVKKL